MNNKIVTVAVVAILIIVAAGVAIMFTNNENSKFTPNETGRLLIYGNANNDDSIDSHDIDMIQSIIDKEVEWNKEAYPFADANNDGAITPADIELVKKIINKTPCEIYYLEYYESLSSKVQSINYPMKTASLGLYQYQVGNLVNMLGLWDNVDYADATTIAQTALFDTSGIQSYGVYSGAAMRTDSALETFYNSDVDVLILNGYWDDTVVKDGLAKMGSKTQVIKPYSQGTYCIASMLTYGFILDRYDQALEYIKFNDNVMSYLDDRFETLKEEDYISYYVVNNPSDPGKININSTGNNGTYPDVAWIEYLPGVNLMPRGDNDNYRAVRSAEWFTLPANASDFIILSLSGLATAYDNDVEAAMNSYKEMFVQTPAYKDDNIVALNYAYFNGLYAPGILALLAAELYPELIDKEYAMELFEEFFDKYNYFGSDGSQKYAGIYKMNS